MLKSLKIENFRCFQKFELQNLGQVNLLVGNNNSGKTSVLEAIQLLVAKNGLENLEEIMVGRGEYVVSSNNVQELYIRSLFFDEDIGIKSRFLISAIDELGTFNISSSIQSGQPPHSPKRLEEIVLFMTREKDKQRQVSAAFSLSPKLTLPVPQMHGDTKDWQRVCHNTHFLTPLSFTADKMLELFDKVVLSPDEDLIVEALQTIEPTIERIASIGVDRLAGHTYSHNGFALRLSDRSERVLIGSMGDGMWRMLGITLALVNAKDGFLLVDEIDTGLHFSAMFSMWKLIWETAKRLNIQVFATTHNSDCWTSLSEVVSADSTIQDGVTIHRIEKNSTKSVVFTERQVEIAAAQGIEVR